jgi:uncharacterized membrane protein YidH (DUF202 family)
MTIDTEPDILDRNLTEILQELRVAQTGVQILLAFLLSMPFTQTFRETTSLERLFYLTALLATVGATSMLIAPVAFHRLLFRRRRRPDIIRGANRFAIAGLALMVVAVAVAVLFVSSFVFGPLAGAIAGAVSFAWFGLWWFAIPLNHRNTRSPVDTSLGVMTPGARLTAQARQEAGIPGAPGRG